MASRRTEKQNMLRNYEKEKEEIRIQEEEDARYQEELEEKIRKAKEEKERADAEWYRDYTQSIRRYYDNLTEDMYDEYLFKA